jgi:hypothetical protein
MSAVNTFEDFLANQAPQIDLGQFVLNLGTAGVLAGLMALLYSRWGRGQSHRTLFAGNFFLLTMTTMLVISVVKSSLALSLGLVGALSVVRFRTAIKDPEELSFLFLSIAVGLGLGADQRPVTVIGLVVILLVYALLKVRGGGASRPGALYVHLSKLSQFSVPELESVLATHSRRVKIKRISEGEAVFLVETSSTENLEKMRQGLKEKLPGVQMLITEYQDLA